MGGMALRENCVASIPNSSLIFAGWPHFGYCEFVLMLSLAAIPLYGEKAIVITV